MRILPVLAAIALTALAQPVAAATFDGHWFADIPAQEKCNTVSTIDLLVADGVISGQIHNPANVVAVTGKVDADGNATFTAMERYPGTMKFSGDRFEATWFNGGCDRHAQGNRALEPAQQGAIAAERKQHQDSYAALIHRAAAGEKVDFTRLRGEFVYSEGWDFYDNKSNGLMTQALAAQKGQDCTGAVEQADQVLKLDFTFAQAHDIKTKCLEDTDRARSRIEGAIADGLDDSLMNSGDGDSEKTAYVVSSMHEEMRALVKRGIQLKTRATELRGSDGHFYDQVQGISIRSNWNGNGISLASKTVFFNVDSFVKGRESRRAAVAMAAATVH